MNADALAARRVDKLPLLRGAAVVGPRGGGGRGGVARRAGGAPRALPAHARPVAEAREQQAEDRRADPFRHPEDAEAESGQASEIPQRAVHHVPPRSEPCPTTIRGRAADTCKGLAGSAAKASP